jgi:hypothetical protein
MLKLRVALVDSFMSRALAASPSSRIRGEPGAGFQHRLRSEVSTLYNFITQEENKVEIVIAVCSCASLPRSACYAKPGDNPNSSANYHKYKS